MDYQAGDRVIIVGDQGVGPFRLVTGYDPVKCLVHLEGDIVVPVSWVKRGDG